MAAPNFPGLVRTMSPVQVVPCLTVLLVFFIFPLVLPVSPITVTRLKSMAAIKDVNRRGPYLGLVTVYPPEENAFFATGVFRPDRKHPFIDLSGRRFRVGKVHGKSVIYVRCGVGMVNAVAALQQMLDLFDITGIVHFGISGNINNSMSVGDVTIPKQFAHTGLWDWLKPNATVGSDYVAQLKFGSYDAAQGEGINQLGIIGFSKEQFYSDSGKPNTPQPLFWADTSQNWLHLATKLEGIELEQCLNSSVCLPEKPKLVVGLRGSTANIFVDNAAYRDFLFDTFQVSSHDMESSAIVMTSLSNGYPVIVIRGLSDLAGAQAGQNMIGVFGPLAALNAAKAVAQFVKIFSGDYSTLK